MWTATADRAPGRGGQAAGIWELWVSNERRGDSVRRVRPVNLRIRRPSNRETVNFGPAPARSASLCCKSPSYIRYSRAAYSLLPQSPLTHRPREYCPENLIPRENSKNEKGAIVV